MTSTGALTPRPAGPDDHDWLFGLHDRAHRTLVERAYGPWEDAQQRAFFRPLVEDFEVLVFERDDAPVAALYLGRREGDVWIELVEVDPSRQGQGIGAEVLAWTIERARAEGTGVLLQVHRVNVDARRLYLRQGFVPVGDNETPALSSAPVRRPGRGSEP